MFRYFAIFSALLCASAVSADQIASAGRLEYLKTDGSCSAVLVRPDVIATAAHCALTDPSEGIVFRPGDGRVGRAYPIKRFIRHPLYQSTRDRVEWRLRFDIAIAELTEPVPEDRATPVAQGGEAMVGERLFLVSWRGGMGDRPRQRICQVIDGIHGLVTLGCAVEGGESGAPILRMTESGLELVAIISSRGQQLDQPVAQASDVRLRLPPLLDELDGS